MARIALILPRLSRYGGVEQFAFRLAGALAETRNCEHEVDFICARAESVPPVGVRARVVGRVGGVKWFKMLWFLVAAERARQQGGYDLTIGLGKSWEQDLLRVGGGPQRTFWALSEQAWPAGLRRWGKRLRRLLLPANWLTRFIENHQYRSGCRIICVSDAVADWLRRDYPHVARPEVIYNLPDLARFRPPAGEERARARRGLGFEDGGIAIGTATSNFALKGTTSLVRALVLLPEAYRLVVAGGRSSRACRRLAERLGVAHRVVFLGRVDDMLAFYHGLDMFALPTFYDACSNAVLEAAACGLPTLSSSANGSSAFLPAERVTPAPGDAADLAARLQKLHEEGPGPAFALPDGVAAGLDTWVAVINEMADARRSAQSPAQCPAQRSTKTDRA